MASFIFGGDAPCVVAYTYCCCRDTPPIPKIRVTGNNAAIIVWDKWCLLTILLSFFIALSVNPQVEDLHSERHIQTLVLIAMQMFICISFRVWKRAISYNLKRS